MRDRDRFWWAYSLVALAFLVGAVWLPWSAIQANWETAQSMQGMGPWATPARIASDNQTILFTSIAGGIVVLLGGIVIGVLAFLSRRRHMRRLAALRGDFAWMPLEPLALNPDAAPDVSAQPLDIQWILTPFTRTYHVLRIGLLLLMGLSQPGLTIASILLTHFAPSLAPVLTIPSAIGQPLSSGDVHNIILNGVFLIVALIFTIWLFVSAGPILILGRPFGVRATENGIESVNEIGWRSRIAWHEARLFEIDSKGDGQIRRTYRLYGQGKSVTWQDYASGLGAGRAPYHATASENALRQAALLNLVTARTGLEPRTIVRSLERPPVTAPTAAPPSYPPYPPMPYPQPASPLAPYPPAPESYGAGSESSPSVAGGAQAVPAVRLELPAEAQRRARNRRSNAVVWAVFALCLVALACAEGVVPVTDYDWVNWASVAALALLALNCVRLAVASARRRKPAVAVAGPPPVAAPELDGSSSAYALSWRAPARNRRRTFVTGLLLAVNLIPGAIAMFQAFGAIFSINPLFNQQPPTDPANVVISVFGGLWDFILGFVLVFLGMGGFVQFVVALRLTRAPAVTVRVDASGLTRLTAFKPILIPWSTMREVVWTPHGIGSAPGYILRTYDSLQTITWPTSPQYLDSTLTPTDARPIGPDELAALVAARIGQAIRISG